MKYNLSSSIVLSLLLTATDWVSVDYKEFAATQAVEASTDCVRTGRIISIQGKVQLKRKEWSDYHTTFVGTEL
ncbi:hypothetical protein, partial [Nostoc commune]